MAGELPSGTVTFLFTDLQGSTTLLQRIGTDAYAELLAEHHRLIRAAVAVGGGSEVDTQGEAFFAAFPSANGAVLAAVRLQRELTELGLAVRAGLHTGQPSVTSTGYVGIDVPRAARICAAGHGGQTVMSHATRELIAGDLPEGVDLRDLGEHRLKDLTRPQRLFELVILGLPSVFPALRTLENRLTNLPVQPTPLIGRRRELASIGELISQDDVRFVTLTGPGGAGKTRLALQAAADSIDDFPQGVLFVALSAIVERANLLPTIAQTVGVSDTAAIPILENLASFFAGKRVLLVLDNLEQLADAASELAGLLAAAPELTFLATSRTPLNVSAEHVFEVPLLSVPDLRHLPDLTALTQYDSVALFIERARAVKADFAVTDATAPAIAEICARLDGLPLAIELAAARTKLLPPQALLTRLGQRFDLLVGGPLDQPVRQQTLRSTIDWSFGLLGSDEQRLFASLAVFAGGCTLEAAEAVCGPEGLLAGLSALVDNNLLRQQQLDGEPRFAMLASIRAYALERLAKRDDRDELARRHATYFMAFAEETEQDFTAVPVVGWAAYESELDNFRSALAWADAHDVELAVRLAASIPFRRFGHTVEAWEWCERMLPRLPEVPEHLHPRALQSAAMIAWVRGKLEPARTFANDALALNRKLGDRLNEGRCLYRLATIAAVGDDYAAGRAYAASAIEIFRSLGATVPLYAELHNLACWEMQHGEYVRARANLEEALAGARGLNNRDGMCNDLCDLGVLSLYERRFEDAMVFFGESLELAREDSWHLNIAYCVGGIGCALASLGEPECAARLLGAFEALLEQINQPVESYSARVFADGSAAVREGLSEPAVAVAWAAGRSLSEVDASRLAAEATTARAAG